MDVQYYVLGKKDNPILLSYLEKYYHLLRGKVLELEALGVLLHVEELLTHTEHRSFILNADNSSLINILFLEYIKKEDQKLQEPEYYKKELQQEIDLFLAGETDKLKMNQ